MNEIESLIFTCAIGSLCTLAFCFLSLYSHRKREQRKIREERANQLQRAVVSVSYRITCDDNPLVNSPNWRSHI
ncbi:unnamed protein product [Auanema sp. JU1783]|nr:unnamed protein product [Auanema sp. JU1783]